MLLLKKFTRATIFCILFFLVSCATTGPDAFLAKAVSAPDKAEFLYQKGVQAYESELIDKNNINAIAEVRGFFANAIAFDPLHSKAQEYLDKVDTFKEKRLKSYVAQAKRLNAKKSRTDKENYELALAVQRAATINAVDKEVLKLKADTSDVRRQVVQTRLTKLNSVQGKILAESKTQNIAKLMPQATRLLTEIDNVDPGNGDAKRSRAAIDAHVSSLAQKDIDLARQRLAQKRFGEAETAILRADRSLAGLGGNAGNEVATIKYQVYFKWAQALFTLKKYGSADQKVTLALRVNRTTEAVDLKTRIAKAASYRDYDAEIDDMLAEIDADIERGDLAGAWDGINRNSAKVKNEANKAKIEKKRDAVLAQLKSVYDEGIASYNDEDYEDARKKFSLVVRIKPDFEQAQPYLERTKNKLRALEGAE